jgi:hypothetical protein
MPDLWSENAVRLVHPTSDRVSKMLKRKRLKFGFQRKES